MPTATRAQGRLGPARLRREGLVVRFSPIKGITPRGTLNQAIYLPCVLNSYLISETALHNEYDTLSNGHFSMANQGSSNARQLRTTSLDSMTVEIDTPWLVATHQDPRELRMRLYEILRSRKPVDMTVSLHPPKLSYPEVKMFVTFRQIDKELRPGETEARYMTLTISEWRDPTTGRRSSGSHVHLPTTHKLTATDTLDSLAHQFYGSYKDWRAIRDANGISKRFGQKTALVSLPGKWKVGAKIKIPKPPKPKKNQGKGKN